MEWIETLKKTGKALGENLTFVLISVAVIVAIYFVAYALELVIKKKTDVDVRKSRSSVSRMTIIAMFSAVAAVLMLFETPLWFVPFFYELDLSEVPIMIGAFAMGPTSGVVMEAIKIVLKILIKGTSTAFVGDFANFVVGCMYIVPAAFIYHLKKTKKNAIIGMVTGTLVMSLAGCILNAYLLIPTFAKLFMPMEAIVAAGTKVNSAIDSVTTLVLLGVLPFNIFKGVVVAIITAVLYKYVRKIIK